MTISTETIISKIQNGLKECAEKYKISGKDIQLVINNGRSIKILLMDKGVLVQNNSKPVVIDICSLFKVSALENMIAVTPYLKKTLASLAKKKGIDEGAINATVYSKGEDFYPSVNLNSYNDVVAELTINDFLT